MKTSLGSVSLVLVLSLVCGFLLFLIIGQGVYVFRLERQFDAAQQELGSMGQIVRVSQDLLVNEFRIPYELAEWEQAQSDPVAVPDKLRSVYHSWSTVRLAGTKRALNTLDQLVDRLPADSRTAEISYELKHLIQDLESRYKRRLRPDVRAQLEGE